MIFKLFFLSMLMIPDSSRIAEQLKFSNIRSIPISGDFFTTDHLGNIYMIRKDEITKYNQNGDSLYSQSFKLQGNIRSADASNALRVFIFYPELNQVAVLDNTLSIQGDIVKLENFDLQFVTLLCQSVYYNQVWVYNTEEFRLVRVNYQFQPVTQSGNLAQIIGKDLNPDFITEGDQRVYLNDPSNGVHVFDLFGAYIQTLPIKNLDRFQASSNFLYYLEDDLFKAYHLQMHEIYSFKLPFRDVRSFRVEKKDLYLLTGSKLHIVSLR
jgi:hypothetical protein